MEYHDISSLKIGDNTYNLKNTTYGNATTSAAGLMSKDDKIKLNGIASGTLGDLQSSTSTSTASTVGKIWSAHVLNDWMSDILGVDLEKTTANMTALEKLFEDGDVSSGIISELNKKWEPSSSPIGGTTQPIYWNGSNFVKTTYTLDKATTDTLGLIKIFGTTNIAVNNNIGRNFGVYLDKNDKAYVHVPEPSSYILPAASSGTLGGIKEGYYGELPSSYGLKFGVKVNLDEPNTEKYGCAYIGIPFAANNHPGLMPSAMFSKLNNISTASSTKDGLMSSAMFSKLNNISTASSTKDGLMSSANYVKLDGIAVGANKIDFASSTADGSINLIKWTESSSYTLLSFVSGSSITLSSTDLAVSDEGEICPVILDSHNKPFVTVPTYPSYNSVSGGPTANTTPGFAGTFKVPQVSQNSSGQVTITDRTITMPSSPTLKASVSTDGSVLTLYI